MSFNLFMIRSMVSLELEIFSYEKIFHLQIVSDYGGLGN